VYSIARPGQCIFLSFDAQNNVMSHFPEKFTNELIHGKYSLGTVIPKHALDHIDQSLFSHIIKRNMGATTALLDWNGMGKNKQKILEMLERTDLEVIKL